MDPKLSLSPDPFTQTTAGKKKCALALSESSVHFPCRQMCSTGKSGPFLLSVNTWLYMFRGHFSIKNTYNKTTQQDIL